MGSNRIAQTERDYARNAQRPDRSRQPKEDPSQRATQEAEPVFVPQRFKQEMPRNFYAVTHHDGKNAGQPANIIFDFIHMVPYFSEQSKKPLAIGQTYDIVNGMVFEVIDPEFAGTYQVVFRPEHRIASYAGVRTR